MVVSASDQLGGQHGEEITVDAGWESTEAAGA